ncbi:hypothetical protein FKM82_025966 [Ascaphus truei]
MVTADVIGRFAGSTRLRSHSVNDPGTGTYMVRLRTAGPLYHESAPSLRAADNKLLEKTSLLKHLTEKLQTELIDSPSRQTTRPPEDDLVPPDSRGSEMQRLKQQGQIAELQAVSGELAYEAFELMKQVQVKENKLEEQQSRIVMLSEWVANLDGERYDLEGRVMVQRCANSVLKQEYDTLLGVRQESEEQLQKEVENQREMIEDLLKKKVLDAENQNQLNDRLAL